MAQDIVAPRERAVSLLGFGVAADIVVVGTGGTGGTVVRLVATGVLAETSAMNAIVAAMRSQPARAVRLAPAAR